MLPSSSWGREEHGVARFAASTAFLAIAAGESIQGAAFTGDLETLPVALRTAGFILLVGYALAPRPVAGAAAAIAFPGRSLPPLVVAFLASVAIAWRRRDPLPLRVLLSR